jgi:aquaporin Z
MMTKKFGAEFIGTFWLVLGGCWSAVLAAAFPNVGKVNLCRSNLMTN